MPHLLLVVVGSDQVQVIAYRDENPGRHRQDEENKPANDGVGPEGPGLEGSFGHWENQARKLKVQRSIRTDAGWNWCARSSFPGADEHGIDGFQALSAHLRVNTDSQLRAW